ncbi:MAG TPA: ArsO family NAD(P)H-dependent flavin-containing monooxygenase [Thermomicrobiales bacterium]|nr:ArsO family NAD(P)H-dependent flavin-containing monooxygenase [Thermomicrobiales bacterium]
MARSAQQIDLHEASGTMDEKSRDVVVIGGGQTGLAAGYYLRRTGLSFVILDAEVGPGGAWRHCWESLRLFSPARWSSLPGYVMPGGTEYYPDRSEVLAYMAEYERRYRLPIERPVLVGAVRDGGEQVIVETDRGVWQARAVVSATGSWRAPYIPEIEGRDQFRGEQIHSAEYESPMAFVGRRVLVVGGANSGAQIMAELSLVADATWVTRREPVFLPDNVDGRVLFERATERYLAAKEGRQLPPESGSGKFLGDVVMLPPVREARDRGDLSSVRMFSRFTRDGVVWQDGHGERIDAVIWCTGFRTALDHLAPLGVVDASGQVETDGTRSVRDPRLWLLGYGEWTGYASATLIGIGRSARATAEEILGVLSAA